MLLIAYLKKSANGEVLCKTNITNTGQRRVLIDSFNMFLAVIVEFPNSEVLVYTQSQKSVTFSVPALIEGFKMKKRLL
jgi:hypothetical protein